MLHSVFFTDHLNHKTVKKTTCRTHSANPPNYFFFFLSGFSSRTLTIYRTPGIDWWCNVCLFTWWIDTRFLLQQFGIGNWWIWTRIDYHPCITSKPTNQVCIGNIRVKSEVPQGFFAVHLLFYIYINDLHCTMKYCIL